MTAPARGLLTVRDLHVAFPTRRGPARVVSGLSFGVSRGETLAIVGESGSGKSVSVLAMLGLLPTATHVSGSALYDGRELIGLAEDDLRHVRGGGIGMVFQDPMTSLNPVLTVERQIVEALRAHGRASKKALRERAAELLDEVGIPDPQARLRAYPHQLSGGMRQRIMIAIALAASPSILIADEPTTALDVTVQAQILELVARLQEEHGMAVVWITHDLGVVAEIASRMLVMYAGRCVEVGATSTVFADPRHPYTKGLLGAVPIVDDDRPARDRDDLTTMPGLPPDPVELPPGCAFYPRCTVRSSARCASEVPTLSDVGDDHLVATFYEPGG